MAANELSTKLKSSSRAILKRTHVPETVQEDDDNPMKSILKKNKKPKLDSSVEEHSKAQQEPTHKSGSRIASQVTVVTDQKLTDSSSKVEKSPSQPKNKPISDNRQSDVNQPKRNEDPLDVAKSGISPDKAVGSEKSRKEVKKEITATEKSGKSDKKSEKKEKEKVKKGKGTESKSSADKKQSPIKSTSKKTTMKIEEEDEEIGILKRSFIGKT